MCILLWQNASDIGSQADADFVSHRYFSVDLQVVWDTVQTNLLPLKAKVKAILEAEK